MRRIIGLKSLSATRINAEILKKHAERFPQVDLFPVTVLAKDWDEAQQKFFADDGIFKAVHPEEAKLGQAKQ
jgi:sulfate/thiosulfate transport system substrate-binding protein